MLFRTRQSHHCLYLEFLMIIIGLVILSNLSFLFNLSFFQPLLFFECNKNINFILLLKVNNFTTKYIQFFLFISIYYVNIIFLFLFVFIVLKTVINQFYLHTQDFYISTIYTYIYQIFQKNLWQVLQVFFSFAYLLLQILFA